MRRFYWLLVLVVLVLAYDDNWAKLKAAVDLPGLRDLKQSGPLIAAALIGWGLGFLVGQIRRSPAGRSFQNRGETMLARQLAQRFVAPDYHLMNHVTLPLKQGSTQIDHILVSRFGVFVIETKDYNGWIFADPGGREWTQVLYKVKFRFQNPIRQNYLHVSAVRELLEFVPAADIRSMVVFVGEAQFKTDVPPGVFGLQGALDHIASIRTDVLSMNRVQLCVGRLETARLSISKQTDVEHVEHVRRRHGTND